MLNFYRKSLEKDAEKFVEKIKKDSKKLDISVNSLLKIKGK